MVMCDTLIQGSFTFVHLHCLKIYIFIPLFQGVPAYTTIYSDEDDRSDQTFDAFSGIQKGPVSASSVDPEQFSYTFSKL